MAHAATISRLTEGLVCSITGQKSGNAKFKQLHDRTVKSLRTSTHARTNQFDVQSKLDGLVEKFAVLNRDDLAEALQSRLDELPSQAIWTPEVLSLLLSLSDRPLNKTKLEDVEALARDSNVGDPALTWEDIIGDDPLDDSAIWDDVERGYHSSDDDLTSDDTTSDDDTRATSISEHDPVALARLHIENIDKHVPDAVEQSSDGDKDVSTDKLVSELSLIREILSMLHGLPSSIFRVNSDRSQWSLGPDVRLQTASKAVVTHALDRIPKTASILGDLRRWVTSSQVPPYTRACQAAVQVELEKLALQLVHVEQRYISPGGRTLASVIELIRDVESMTHPLTSIGSVILSMDAKPRSLDKLYHGACVAQLTGDSQSFRLAVRVLSATLTVYLRSTSRWITAGELVPTDCGFFVEEADANCALENLWRDRYALQLDEYEHVQAPDFLAPFVDHIFALGKSRAFRGALENNEEASSLPANTTAFLLDSAIAENDILPFPQLFSDAVETWIDEQSKDSASLLPTALLSEQGLLTTLEAMGHVFCSRNGRLFQTFADTLFWRMDAGSRWANDFLMTELAQSTLGSASNVVAERISVRALVDNGAVLQTLPSIRQLRSIQVDYSLSWPLQNITGSPSPQTHGKALTLLLQTYRAKFLLRQLVSIINNLDARTNTLARGLQSALRLQQHLCTLVDLFHTHITSTADLLSTACRTNLEGAGGIDAMAQVWEDYERQLGVSLLVADKLKPVREAIVAMLELSERFADAFVRLVTDREDENEDTPKGDFMQSLHKELDASLSFMIAGLRGIGRAGGNVSLEELAERLDWIVH